MNRCGAAADTAANSGPNRTPAPSPLVPRFLRRTSGWIPKLTPGATVAIIGLRWQPRSVTHTAAHTAPAAGIPGRPCSIAAALQLVGEKWALLAIREIAFGNCRFDAIARNTGAPRDRLAARLRAMEA